MKGALIGLDSEPLVPTASVGLFGCPAVGTAYVHAQHLPSFSLKRPRNMSMSSS